MKLFENIRGKHTAKYGDDIVNIRIPCSKRAGEEASGKLGELLSKLGLKESTKAYDLKKRIWECLNIQEEPAMLTKEQKTIFEKNINNALDIPILRNKEGMLLISSMGLRQDIGKEEFESALISEIMI